MLSSLRFVRDIFCLSMAARCVMFCSRSANDTVLLASFVPYVSLNSIVYGCASTLHYSMSTSSTTLLFSLQYAYT